jgi:hypothetical protein
MSIFRKEALEYQCMRLSGTVSLRADRRLGRMAILFVVLSTLAIIYFWNLSVSSTLSLQCDISSGKKDATVIVPARKARGSEMTRIEVKIGRHSYSLMPSAGGDTGRISFHLKSDVDVSYGEECVAVGYLNFRPAEIMTAKLLRKP